MTNSTPKSSKIVRQGSPNGHQGGKKSSGGGRNSSYARTVTYFANGLAAVGLGCGSGGSPAGRGNIGPRSSAGRHQSCSPPSTSSSSSPSSSLCGSARSGAAACGPSAPRSVPNRGSPMRHDSPRGSPTNSFYAGAKFSEPPSPTSLPKPPSHWTGLIVGCQREVAGRHISQNFNMILNVQA